MDRSAAQGSVVGESPALWGAKRVLKELYGRMRPHRFERSLGETMRIMEGAADSARS